MSLGNSAESDLLKLIAQNIAWANVGNTAGLQPSGVAGSLYVALHTANPGQAGNQSTSEATYGSYARQPVVRSSAGWTVSSSNPTQVANAAVLTFPTATSGSETELYFSVGTLISGAGEILWYAPLAQSVVVVSGVIPIFPISSLVCKMQ